MTFTIKSTVLAFVAGTALASTNGRFASCSNVDLCRITNLAG